MTADGDACQACAPQTATRNASIRRAAFSLIELLVVVGIIAVLAMMLLASITVVRDRARSAVCQHNLRSIGTALLAYAKDFDGFLPWGEGGPSGGPYAWTDAITLVAEEEPVRPTCPAAMPRGGTRHFTGNLQTLTCRTFGANQSTLKPVNLNETGDRKVLLFDGGLGQNPNGLNSFYSSMSMGFTFYYHERSGDNASPQPDPGTGGFRVSNRHTRKANYLFSGGRVGSYTSAELLRGDFRIVSRGRRYY